MREQLEHSQLLELLYFCTSLKAIPLNGLQPPITVWIESGAQPQALPSASTCARELYVPLYGDSETLKLKFEQALPHASSDGFQLR